MKSYRASILWFAPHSEGAACARFEEDGLLVVGANAAGVQVVQAVGHGVNWPSTTPVCQ